MPKTQEDQSHILRLGWTNDDDGDDDDDYLPPPSEVSMFIKFLDTAERFNLAEMILNIACPMEDSYHQERPPLYLYHYWCMNMGTMWCVLCEDGQLDRRNNPF